MIKKLLFIGLCAGLTAVNVQASTADPQHDDNLHAPTLIQSAPHHDFYHALCSQMRDFQNDEEARQISDHIFRFFQGRHPKFLSSFSVGNPSQTAYELLQEARKSGTVESIRKLFETLYNNLGAGNDPCPETCLKGSN